MGYQDWIVYTHASPNIRILNDHPRALTLCSHRRTVFTAAAYPRHICKHSTRGHHTRLLYYSEQQGRFKLSLLYCYISHFLERLRSQGLWEPVVLP